MDEHVFEAVLADRLLAQALIAFYLREQQRSGSRPDAGTLKRLAACGVLSWRGTAPVLTPAGACLAYNLLELENQVARGAVRPVLERLGIGPGSVLLDAGCGGGQTLLAAAAFKPRLMIGLDRDRSSIDFARFLFRRRGLPEKKWVLQARRLEDMGIPPGSCTHAVCRGVLHKTRVVPVLALLAAGLKPGGRIYLMVPTPAYYLGRLKLLRRGPGWLLFFLFVFANGCLFAVSGRQLTIGAGRRLMSEMFLTAGALARAMRRQGFRGISFCRAAGPGRFDFIHAYAVRGGCDA